MHESEGGAEGLFSVRVLEGERALLHFLEAKGHHAVVDTSLNQLVANVDSRRATAAVVVHIVDRDPREPHLVKSPLSGAGVSGHIAAGGLLDLSELDPGVMKGPQRCLFGHFVVIRVVLSAWLDELGHTHSDHKHSAHLIYFNRDPKP